MNRFCSYRITAFTTFLFCILLCCRSNLENVSRLGIKHLNWINNQTIFKTCFQEFFQCYNSILIQVVFVENSVNLHIHEKNKKRNEHVKPIPKTKKSFSMRKKSLANIYLFSCLSIIIGLMWSPPHQFVYSLN